MKKITKDGLLRRVNQLMQDDLKLVAKKGEDYAPEDDALANLREFGVQGILVRLCEKVARLKNLILSGKKPANESVIDTFRDIRIYSYLAAVIADLQEDGGKEEEPVIKNPKIYIAGPLTPKGAGNPAIIYLKNVHEMLAAWEKLLSVGWLPFCPAFDLLGILFHSNPAKVETDLVKRNSLAYLEDCSAIVLLKGWESSEGSLAELSMAKRLGKKIFYNLKDAIHYAKEFRIWERDKKG